MSDEQSCEKKPESETCSQPRIQPVNVMWLRERKMRVIREYFENRGRALTESDQNKLDPDLSTSKKFSQFADQCIGALGWSIFPRVLPFWSITRLRMGTAFSVFQCSLY